MLEDISPAHKNPTKVQTKISTATYARATGNEIRVLSSTRRGFRLLPNSAFSSRRAIRLFSVGDDLTRDEICVKQP